MNEASSFDTPYRRGITSDGWFVLNLADAVAVRDEEKGGATYPLESGDHPFADVGVHVKVLWPGDPNAVYHVEGAQEGFLVLTGECTLIVGGRPDGPIHYPVSEAAARYGASVRAETDDPDHAYADWPGAFEPLRLPWPDVVSGT